MAKSKKILVLTGFLLLLLASQVAFQVSTGNESETDDNSKVNMISGVLAHDMNESQARSLSENGFFVEADVELEENSRWQTIYSLCKQYNISLIGKICHNTMDGNISVPSNADWIQTIQTAVNNFSDVVKYWEIWNEPTDNEHFFLGNASEYTWMLKVANQTIKTISPNAVIIGLGGLHLYSGIEEWVTKGFDFAGNVTALGGLDYCDAISLHAYPWGNYTAEVGDNITKSLESYRNLTQNKPIWITETGQHSNSRGYDEKDQAAFLYNSYKLLKNQNVSAYIWYQLSDSQGDIIANDTFGLFTATSSPKMAFQTYTMVKSENVTGITAVNYLVSRFDSEVGLIYETPDNNGTTFWLYSDNYLVQVALAHYTQNQTIAQILRTIETASSNLTKNEKGIINQYQILNYSQINLPIKNSTNCKIAELNGRTINCTINNGTGTLSAENYADIAFLEAIAYQNENQTEKAIGAYQKGVTTWNETGFIDEAYNDSRGFDTFKLALYICASKAIGHPFDVRAYNNLLACQQSTGGFATYYTANNVTNAQTNTETTALALLALTYEPKIETNKPATQPTPTPTLTPTSSPKSSTTSNTQTNPQTPLKTPTATPSPTITPTPNPTTVTTTTPTVTPQATGDLTIYIIVGLSVVGLVIISLWVMRNQRVK